jgi:hypothetical protein
LTLVLFCGVVVAAQIKTQAIKSLHSAEVRDVGLIESISVSNLPPNIEAIAPLPQSLVRVICQYASVAKDYAHFSRRWNSCDTAIIISFTGYSHRTGHRAISERDLRFMGHIEGGRTTGIEDRNMAVGLSPAFNSR